MISCFAIVILSVIGSMFANGHHSMMGSEEDPEDGGAVAASVFGAVIVYAVSHTPKDEPGAREEDKEVEARKARRGLREDKQRLWEGETMSDNAGDTGFPSLLRLTSLPAPPSESTG